MLIDGEEVNEETQSNISVIEYIDNDDHHADDLQMITLDPNIFAGKKEIDLSLIADNWQGTNKSKAVGCGTFHIDLNKDSDIAGLYVVKAAAITSASEIRQTPRDQAWERANLKEIAEEIAERNSVQLIYAAMLNPVFVRKEQLQTSDVKFLDDLCKSVGLTLKFTANSLIIFNRYEYGENTPVRTFKKGEEDILDDKLHHELNDTAYQKCCVSYKDTVKGELISCTYKRSETGRQLNVTRKVSSTAEAILAAKYAIMEKNAKEYTGMLYCSGDISLAVGSVIKLSGYGEYDKNYMITKAIHMIKSGIYTTRIFFEQILEDY